MNNPIIPVKKVSLVFLLLGLSVVVASEKANAAAMDTENGPDIEAILAAAKIREDAGRVNFCGFFVGMSRYDAQALADHYQLEQGSYDFGNAPSVVLAAFTLKAVRRIVRRGNTFDELKRAVERQIGDMEFAPNIPNRAQIERAQSLLGDLGVAILEDETSEERYERKTIDGDIVRMGEKSGLIILNNEVAKSQNPVWESDWAKAKSSAVAAAAVEKERADKAKEEKLWTEKGAKAVSAMIENMLYVRGRGYLMAKYEVTQALWMAVMGENPSEYKGIDHPVENVSWNDCQIFLKKLNAMDEVKKSGLSFRLPTDSEWCFACLGGAPLPNRKQRSSLSSGTFSNSAFGAFSSPASPASDESYAYCLLADGTKITKYSLNKVAWFREDGEWPCKTHQPVGQKLPNAFGLFDMHGNVWEWTSAMHKNKAVACGGCWCSEAFKCESDYQKEFDTDYCDSTVGLRLAADDLKAIAKAKKAQEEQLRKMSADSNVRVTEVKSVLEKMGVETVVVELPGGVQFLVNKLPNGEWFGAFEVTQAQWMSVMRRNPSNFKGGDHPVENVSWSDCQKFIEAVNALDAVRKMGFVFRLPTDDQWEYACLAGSKGDYCLGPDGKRIKKSTLGEVAWYGDNSDGKTHPVGQKKPNAFGLYDIHGNVCEWMSTPRSTGHVVCGGGWSDKENVRGSCCFIPLPSSNPPCTAGRRLWSDSSLRDIGLRLAADDPKAFAKSKLESNTRVAAVKPDLVKMGVETMIVELPGGVQLLINKLPNGKWFGAFEVTQAQWLSVMGGNPSKFDNGGDFPIECVSWYECQAFLQNLNALEEVRKSGLTFRLPTAEEWRYACRADALANYCRLADGTEISSSSLDAVAWYEDNSNKQTHSVGQKQPNAFGLYDILGNVSEWTSTEGITSRATGGGNWYSPASLCDSGIGKFSDWTNAGYQGSGIGFRLAADDGE